MARLSDGMVSHRVFPADAAVFSLLFRYLTATSLEIGNSFMQ